MFARGRGDPCGRPRAAIKAAPTSVLNGRYGRERQAGAAGALRSKPPPPEDHQENSLGEVPRRGNRNSPFLAVSRGGLLRRGKSAPQRKANVPVARLQRRPQWLCRGEGTITGARRRHDKKTGVKKGNMEGASAWNKVGRCGQKVNCPEGARESALGRRPLR